MYPFCFLVARRGNGVHLTESGVGRVGQEKEEKINLINNKYCIKSLRYNVTYDIINPERNIVISTSVARICLSAGSASHPLTGGA